MGGRQEPTGKKQLNRAYMSSQPIGSSMKPLAVYGPAIDVMNYGAGSIVWNMQGPVDGWISDKGYPPAIRPTLLLPSGDPFRTPSTSPPREP